MKKILLFFATFSILGSIISCEKDYNDWDVDPSYDGLFRSIVFEASRVEPTAVELKFTKAISGTKYVFEFSKDSLEFNEIVRTVEVLADTLTPFATSTNQTKVEYRETFEGLNGTTGYSVRMKSVDEINNKESEYSQLYFETPAEQIFTNYLPTTSSLALNWTITPEVTNIVLYNENLELLEDFNLTDQQKSSGTILLENLDQGTNYVIEIFNESNKRGTLNVGTTGLYDSEIYKVLPSDNAESINSAVTDLVSGGTSEITVEFDKGITYSIDGDINIPTGVTNIAFVGSADESGELPKLENVRFRVENEANDILIQYLETTSSGSHFVELGGNTVHDISIEGCNVSDINSIIRISGGSVVNDVFVNNSWISETGGWGLLNVGSDDNIVNSINVTNCTLTEISTRFADVRVSTEINFGNVTCVNIDMGMGHLWRFDNNRPVQVSIEDCILGGPNGGVPLDDTNGDYDNINITYNSTYKTNDLMINSRPLQEIVEVPLDIYGLFVDPENGNFHIKEGVGFAGTGVAGDPRWFGFEDEEDKDE